MIRENPEKRSDRSPDYWVFRGLSFPVSSEWGAVPDHPMVKKQKPQQAAKGPEPEAADYFPGPTEEDLANLEALHNEGVL